MVASVLLLASFVLVSRLTALPFGVENHLNVSTTTPLRFTAEGTFQIAVFEDLHYGEGKNRRQTTRKAGSMLTLIILLSRRHGLGTRTRCIFDEGDKYRLSH